MPQITVIPRQHWNFKAIPKDIDVARILEEAGTASESIVRVRMRFVNGVRSYLFVLRASDDAKALQPLLSNLVVSSSILKMGIATTTTKGIQYTPLGLAFDAIESDWTWLVVAREDLIDQAIQRIYRQRDLLKRRQRVTVECL